MILAALVLALGGSVAAGALEERTPAAPAHGKQAGDEGAAHASSVPEVVFHHVTDGRAWEVENPLYGTIEGSPKNLLVVSFGHGRGHAADEGLVLNVPVDLKFTLGQFTLDLTPTKHALMMWVVAGMLLLLLLRAVRRRALVPRGLYSIVEMVVGFLYEEVSKKNFPDEESARRYTPYLCSVFFFILFMNLWGLLPFMATATSNLAITGALALCTFLLTQYAGIRSAGVLGYFKHLTGGVHPLLWPIMIPVEFLGLFTKPFALTVRLFANMVAGHIVLYFLVALIFIVSGWMFLVSVPFALGVFLLEILVAFIQAFVFTLLSGVFIGMGVAMGHHGHGEQEHHA